MKVLCVDDSGLFRHTLRKQLQVLSVWEIVDKEDAAAAASHLEIDPDITIIIADHHMAAGSGLDFLKWVRSHANERIRELPFIMVTANSERELILTAAQEGVSHFLVKPLGIEKLKQAIGRFRDTVYA